MIKTVTLLGVALLTFAASGFSMHKAGWFNSKPVRVTETRQSHSHDPLHSEAGQRYRYNQSTHWKVVMALR
jgi:hypothetical protein